MLPCSGDEFGDPCGPARTRDEMDGNPAPHVSIYSTTGSITKQYNVRWSGPLQNPIFAPMILGRNETA